VAALAACALAGGPAGAAHARGADYTLRIFVNGRGTVHGTGINCGNGGTTCGSSYTTGAAVTLEAEPAPSSVFAGWSGACTGIATTCTFTAGDPTTVTASFAYIEVVDVNKSGEGTGTVTSSPAGVSCGSTCSAPFTGNTKVTLTARAAPGSVFVGWTGYCKGKATCAMQQTYGTMTVSAEFRPVGKGGHSTTRSSGTGTGTSGGSPKTGGSASGGSGPEVRVISDNVFRASSMGATVRKTPTGRLITINFSVSKSAAVKLEIWSWRKRLISRARVAVNRGRVRVNLPFSAAFHAGPYDVWGYVTGDGEKRYRLLHWKVQIP
jgi:hypothetical protein